MNMENALKDAAGLYRLVFLLTGRSDLSIDIAADAASASDGNAFFPSWMSAWSRRRIVIAKSLAVIRHDLAASVRRTELARVHQSGAPPRVWSRSTEVTNVRIEEALLAIDVFPRAALLLTVFERVSIRDVAVLLDANFKLIRKGQAIGLLEYTNSVAQKARHSLPGLSLVLAT